MTTLLDPKVTLAYLAYLGFPGSPTSALSVTKPRKSERKKNKVTRTTFLIYVLGAAGSGKTAICRNLAGKRFSNDYVPTSGPSTIVNSVEHKGAEKYLVVRRLASSCEVARS